MIHHDVRASLEVVETIFKNKNFLWDYRKWKKCSFLTKSSILVSSSSKSMNGHSPSIWVYLNLNLTLRKARNWLSRECLTEYQWIPITKLVRSEVLKASKSWIWHESTINHSIKHTYSAKCLLVLDVSALYDWAIQKQSPTAGMAVSRYNWDDWVKYAGSPK